MIHAEDKSKPAISGRRRVPRRTFETNVGILLHGEYGLERSYQVGEGGMMIACSRAKLKEGDTLVVNFFLPSGELVMVRGEVRSEVPAKGDLPVRYGIEFMNLEFQMRRAIRNFVAAATRMDGQIYSNQ